MQESYTWKFSLQEISMDERQGNHENKKKKKAVFERYKQTAEGKDYLEYGKMRNAAKAETRRAIQEYERET